VLPTQKSYESFFNKEKNFTSLVLSAFKIQFNKKKNTTIVPIIVAAIVSIIILLFMDKSILDKPVINDLSRKIIEISVSIIGFMTIAYTLLMTIANNKLSMWLFCDTSSEYKVPPIKLLLAFFCYPISLFLMSFLVSLIVFLVSTLSLEIKINTFIPIIGRISLDISSYYGIINNITVFVLSFFVVLSLIELIPFFYNTYIFIVLYFGKLSAMQEREIITKLTNDIDLDSFEQPFEKDIIEAADEPDP
jgi:hypothetical protein